MALGFMSTEEPEIHGEIPDLADKTCDQLLVEQYWNNGTLSEPANVIYFRCGSIWHRLTFDHGIIFWREQTAEPIPYAMDELNSETRISDLGQQLQLQGHRFTSCHARAVQGGSEVTFEFNNGRVLTFQNISDHTTWR